MLHASLWSVWRCCCFGRADCVAQPVDPGAVRVGDRWAYDVRDDLTGDLRRAITVVVVEINDKEITTRVSSAGKDRPQTMVYDLDWGRIDDGAWKLRPSGIGIKQPLQIGKEGGRMPTRSIRSPARLCVQPGRPRSWGRNRSRRRPEHSIRFGST